MTDYLPLGDITELITKGTTPSTLGGGFASYGINFVKVESISDGGIIIKDKLAYIDEATHAKLARSVLRKDDILFSIAGAIGRTTRVTESVLPANTNQALAIIRVDQSKACVDYVHQCVQGDAFIKTCSDKSVKSAQANVSLGSMAKAMMYLPPLAEQRKIAEILRTWDEAIETAEAELKAKQERKRWLITMVMRKSYGTKSVSQFGTLKKGGAILREKLRSEGVPVVLYGDIYTKYSEIVTRLISRVDASAVVDGVKLNSGDIVFAGSGETAEEIGKCIAYVGEEAAFAGGDVVILSNHGQDPRYLGYALNSEDAIRQKMRLGQGSSVMHLYKDDVASIKIPLPPISDQRKVGEILSEADTDIELINQRINVLRAQKRGLMQKLLTGEVRVAA
jgi:type I restriction enzyme S subunit